MKRVIVLSIMLVFSVIYLVHIIDDMSAHSTRISENYKKKEKENKELNLNSKSVKISAYTSHENQTDDSPFVAAWNNKLSPSKHKKRIIAVSRDLLKDGLEDGEKVILKFENKMYLVEVRDKMNKRWRDKVDLYFGVDHEAAMKFGVKQGKIIWR